MKAGNIHQDTRRGRYAIAIAALIALWGCSKKSPTVAPPAPQDTPWTWSEIHCGGQEPWSLDVDPRNGNILYVASHHDSGGIWKSTDGGASFTKVWSEGAWDVTVDPNNSSVIYIACSGILRSRDGGGTWSRLIDSVAWYVQPDRFDSSFIFAGGYRSTDYGLTWQRMNPFYDIQDLVQSRYNANLLYLVRSMYGFGLTFRSSDRGATWVLVGNPRRTSSQMDIDPLDDQRIYTGTFHGRTADDSLHRSTDGGITWEAFPIGQDTLWGGQVPVVVDPRWGLGRVLYAGGQGMHRSIDYGKTWRLIGLEGVCIRDIAVDATAPTSTTVLYVAAPCMGNPGYCDRIYKGTPAN